MVLKQRETTRWTARVGTWVVAAISFLWDVLKSLLNFKEEDELLGKGKKAANLLVRRIVYFVADYYLVGVSAAIVAAMKHLGFAFLWAFVALWVFDFVVAGAFVFFYEKTGKDLSLGVDYRRAIDTAYKKSRITGIIAIVLFIIKAIFWTGPEQVVTFFRKEIRTILRVIIVLLVLTAIQAVIWTMIYGFGYGLVAKMF